MSHVLGRLYSCRKCRFFQRPVQTPRPMPTCVFLYPPWLFSPFPCFPSPALLNGAVSLSSDARPGDILRGGESSEEHRQASRWRRSLRTLSSVPSALPTSFLFGPTVLPWPMMAPEIKRNYLFPGFGSPPFPRFTSPKPRTLFGKGPPVPIPCQPFPMILFSIQMVICPW